MFHREDLRVQKYDGQSAMRLLISQDSLGFARSEALKIAIR